MNRACTETKSAGVLAVTCVLLMFVSTPVTLGQTQNGGFATPSSSAQEYSDSESNSTQSAPPASSSTNPFLSSVPEGKASSAVVPLSFKDAMDRALRTNLGLLLASDTSLSTRSQRLQELSHLLPSLSASANQSVEQIDLAALGFRFKFPGVSPVVGPIGVFDARFYLSAPLFDWHAIERERGARANEAAARYGYNDARGLVGLAAGQ